jgi:hypothetical protein
MVDRFQILSLDGGGIKGIFSAAVLHILKMICKSRSQITLILFQELPPEESLLCRWGWARHPKRLSGLHRQGTGKISLIILDFFKTVLAKQIRVGPA